MYTHIGGILNETKEKINKTITFELIAHAVVSNDIRTPGTPASRDGKGGWSCRQ